MASRELHNLGVSLGEPCVLRPSARHTARRRARKVASWASRAISSSADLVVSSPCRRALHRAHSRNDCDTLISSNAANLVSSAYLAVRQHYVRWDGEKVLERVELKAVKVEVQAGLGHRPDLVGALCVRHPRMERAALS